MEWANHGDSRFYFQAAIPRKNRFIAYLFANAACGPLRKASSIFVRWTTLKVVHSCHDPTGSLLQEDAFD